MRRALLHEWPALSRIYGLLPIHTPDLSIDEINAYMADLAALRAAVDD